MKKTYFISVLIASLVAVGISESPEVTISKDMDMPGPAVHDGQPSLLEKTRENVKRIWANTSRRVDDKERDVSPGERYEVMRRGTENGELQDSERMSLHVQSAQTPSASPESEYLMEIASVLSIPVLKEDTPGDVAFKIRQCIGNAERYSGNVLSDESFEKAKSAIRIPSDAETFAEYHKFIRNIAGKKYILVESKGCKTGGEE